MTPDIDDPDLPLAELFRAWPATARVFWARRLACVGCPIAPFHTVSDTCAEYRQDEASFREALRAVAVGPPMPPPPRSRPPGGAQRSR